MTHRCGFKEEKKECNARCVDYMTCTRNPRYDELHKKVPNEADRIVWVPKKKRLALSSQFLGLTNATQVEEMKVYIGSLFRTDKMYSKAEIIETIERSIEDVQKRSKEVL